MAWGFQRLVVVRSRRNLDAVGHDNQVLAAADGQFAVRSWLHHELLQLPLLGLLA